MKAKKCISLLLVAVLLLSLAACTAPSTKGNPTDSPAPTAEPAAPTAAPAAEPTAQPAPTAEPNAATLPALEGDAQIGILAANIPNLQLPQNGVTWKLAVTDLDHNGRLELIAAGQHTETRDTNLKIWEINPEKNGLAEARVNLPDEETFPDILAENADTYFNASSNSWDYLFYDTIILTVQEAYTNKCAVEYKDGVLGYQSLAYQHIEYVEGQQGPTVTFLDVNGSPITGDAYNASGNTAFNGWIKTSTNLDWFPVGEAKMMSRLVDSYYVFTGQKSPNKDSGQPVPAPTPAPSAAPTAAPMPTWQPAPTPVPQPQFLMITKNPTNENRRIGGTALFVSCANVFTSLEWTFVNQGGDIFSPADFQHFYPNCSVSGIYGTTLSIANVSADMNGWSVYCTFYYNGQTARTNSAYLYIQNAPQPTDPPAPGGVIGGTVTDFLMSSVTMRLDNWNTVQVLKDICTVDGDLFIGATCEVFYNGAAPNAGSIYHVYITGSQPQPPVYGTMAGNIHNIGGMYHSIDLANGQSVTIPDSICNVVYGDMAEGCSCTVYYRDYPAEENIYSVDVYGVTTGLIIPDQQPPQITGMSGNYSNGRGGMTVSGSPGYYSVYVNWSSSASEHTEWSFSGDFDNYGVMYYNNCTMTTTTYDDNGNEMPQKFTYNGSGILSYSAAGETMTWTDYNGDINASVFSRS